MRFVRKVAFAFLVVGAIALGVYAALSLRLSGNTVENRADAMAATLVFRQTEYSVKSPRLVFLTRDETVSLMHSGTGFAIDSGRDGPALVTARHVAVGEPLLSELHLDGEVYTAGSSPAEAIQKTADRVRVGYKSAVPTNLEIDQAYQDLDIAVLAYELSDLEPVVVHPTSEPARDERVILWGYPADVSIESNQAVTVSNMARRELVVTNLESQYFVCESPVEVGGGFSGGPILNTQGAVIGMAVRSNGTQVRCVYAKDLLLAVESAVSDNED